MLFRSELEEKIDHVVTEQKDSYDSFKRDVRTTWNEEMGDQPFEPTRDENGIQILKFCDKCDIGNPIDATYCVNCGEKLK